MKKVEAATLEEAYAKASKLLACSISELQYEVIQYPSKGILGFLKKSAIIVATSYKKEETDVEKAVEVPAPSIEESVADSIMEVVKQTKAQEKEKVLEDESVLDSFFEVEKSVETPLVLEDEVCVEEEENIVYEELALLIENQLKELLTLSCFDINIVEVDVRDNTALIFIDGEDAALLIGKEGYRYNALSYMIFNWLHAKYELFIKLEIAEFLTTQQEMIAHYLLPVIETIELNGRGKTRFLDGILVQIALEQLREHFPDKYVAVKTGRDGKKFVVVNEFKSSQKNHYV
jgi:spoIIIJ-associated protein